MTSRAGFDRCVEAWFAEDALAEPPAFLAGAIAHATRRRRPRRRWHAILGRAWAGDATLTILGLTGRGVLIVAASALVAALLAAGALLAGSSPPRLATPASPDWSFVLPPCDAVTPPSGPLPDTQGPPFEDPVNGLIALEESGTVELVQPVGGVLVGSLSFRDVSGTPLESVGWPSWSPDGRWLSVWLSTSCGTRTPVLVASDGSQAVEVPAAGDPQTYVAWSPDGQWIATANGSSVDVFRIGSDGSVLESRRVWESPPEGLDFVAWGPDGTLAITDRQVIQLLRPGRDRPEEIAPGLGLFAPLAWSGDGTTIVTAAQGGSIPQVYAISPVTGSATAISGAAPVPGGKFWDVPLVTAGDRVFWIGGGMIQSVVIDGTDLRQVTAPSSSMDPWLMAASPDGRSIAFTTGVLWLVDVDGGDPSQVRRGSRGAVSWQAIP